MDSAMSKSALGIKRLPVSNNVTLLPNPAYMVATHSDSAGAENEQASGKFALLE